MRTPAMTRIVARTGRNTLSGTRALRWPPKKMPGREPLTSEPSSTQSTDPKASGRRPRSRSAARHGRCRSRRDGRSGCAGRAQREPSFRWRRHRQRRASRIPEQEPGEGRQCRGPPRIRLRMPRRGCQTEPPMRQDAERGHDKGDAQSGSDQGRRGVALDAQDTVRIVAGVLPAASRPVTRQSTVPLSPCVRVPPVLVIAA